MVSVIEPLLNFHFNIYLKRRITKKLPKKADKNVKAFFKEECLPNFFH